MRLRGLDEYGRLIVTAAFGAQSNTGWQRSLL